MDISNIEKKLYENQKIFFDELSLYINLPLYFYGSILRNDYIKGKSDIDIDIFTSNVKSTLNHISNHLQIGRNEFKKFFYKINDHLVKGYKVKYFNEQKQIDIELSVYDDKYKSFVLRDHAKDATLPFYITTIIMILKFLFYYLNILPKNIYQRCKRFLMNTGDELKFIQIDI